ncbi:kinase, partial [Thraustotheca clavata]
YIENNNIKVIKENELPTNLTELFIANNSLTELIGHNWTNIVKLSFENNPITTFAHNELSTEKLEYFNCVKCPLTNITLSQESYEALNKLALNSSPLFEIDANVSTNPTKCGAVHGEIKQLLVKQAKYTITACVMLSSALCYDAFSDIMIAPIKASQSDRTGNESFIGIGACIGASIAIIFLLLYFAHRKYNDDDLLEEFAVLDMSTLEPYRLGYRDIVRVGSNPIASGGFGDVWEGRYAGNHIAIKRMKSSTIEQIVKFINEISLISKLQSPYIVEFIGVSWRRPNELDCVFEFMNLGNLRNYLATSSTEDFGWDDKLISIIFIAEGLAYLHTYSPPIIHRDLKSLNVLLDSQKGTKLSDFGEAKELSDDTITKGVGTYLWMAPEVIEGHEYTQAADIFSFGIILSEYCTHELPYYDVQKNGGRANPFNIAREVCQGILRPSYKGPGVPEWLPDLAIQCIAIDPSTRPTSLALTDRLTKLSKQKV